MTKKAKKPLAHEVILGKLEALKDRYNELNRTIEHTQSYQGNFRRDCRAEQSFIYAQAMALVEILITMHIPKAARKEAADGVRWLPALFYPPMAIDIFEEIENNE